MAHHAAMSREKKALRPLDVHAQRVLAELVRMSGRSHASIGREVGLSQNRVSTILRGNTPPATLGELAVIAEALGVTGAQVLAVAEARLAKAARVEVQAVTDEAEVINIIDRDDADPDPAASAVVDPGGVVVPMRRRGVYGSGQVVEELPEGALERAAAQVVEGDAEDEVEGFGRRP